MDIVRVRPHPSAVLRGSTVGEGGFETVEYAVHGLVELADDDPIIRPPASTQPDCRGNRDLKISLEIFMLA